MEIKTEADSDDMTECLHDDRPSTGMFGFPDSVFLVPCGNTAITRLLL